MKPEMALGGGLLFVLWLLWIDSKRRQGLSAGLWLAVIWLSILGSRPVSSWFGVEGVNPLEGSAVDRVISSALIVSSLGLLVRRQVSWGSIVRENKALFLLLTFWLISTLWSEYPLVGLKRLVKDFGHVMVALVILSERRPVEAFKAVAIRCACIVFPLSLVVIKWFPEIGRSYHHSTGEMMTTGLTMQKNSLGAIIFVCGLVLFWELLQQWKVARSTREPLRYWAGWLLLGIGLLLLRLSDSKTSMVCMAVGAVFVMGAQIAWFRRHARAIAVLTLCSLLAAVAAESLFQLKAKVLAVLGRDATLTGRTDIWRVVLDQETDPILGEGFLSFWDSPRGLAASRELDGLVGSTHNGYLDIYVNGGAVGLVLLASMLAVGFLKSLARMRSGGAYEIVCFAILLTGIINNVSEGTFHTMSPVWFVFLIAYLGRIPGLLPGGVLPKSTFCSLSTGRGIVSVPEQGGRELESPGESDGRWMRNGTSETRNSGVKYAPVRN